MTTEESPSRVGLLFRLYGASILLVLSQTAAILVAKSFNSAVTQSIDPSTACTESPAGSWSSFGIQLAFCLVVSLIVLRVWFRNGHVKARANTSTWYAKLWDIQKFMFGEILGWAYKELTAIGVALMAGYVGYVQPEEDEDEGRLLRDAFTGDAPLSETENEWLRVAGYAIYASILAVVGLLLFMPLKKTVEAVVAHVYKVFKRVRRLESTLEREETDDLAEEFSTEALKISLAYCINGVLAGMIHLVIVSIQGGDDLGTVAWGAVGVLEVYCLTLIFLGAVVFGRKEGPCCGPLKFMDPIAEFTKDVWGCLAGFALGSIATSPGGFLSGVSFTSDFGTDAFKSAIVSLIALCFLFHGSHIRVYRIVCCQKLDANSHVAKHTSHFFQTAASLAFAWAWEDCINDFICNVLPEELGLQPTAAVWVNAAFFIVIMTPLACYLSIQAKNHLEAVEKDLDKVNGVAPENGPEKSVEGVSETGKDGAGQDEEREEIHG